MSVSESEIDFLPCLDIISDLLSAGQISGLLKVFSGMDEFSLRTSDSTLASLSEIWFSTMGQFIPSPLGFPELPYKGSSQIQ